MDSLQSYNQSLIGIISQFVRIKTFNIIIAVFIVHNGQFGCSTLN